MIPECSVIICTFNHEKWIERCVRSLLNQDGISKDSYEIIVVDDASTDKTQELLENFSIHKNIRVFANPVNSGLPAAINQGIRLSRGRYVVRVDSDDYVSRLFLSLTCLFLNMNRYYQAVAVDYIKVTASEEVIERVNCFEEQIACGVMFRKECLIDIGLYDEAFKMREGHELRRRFDERFLVGRLEFPLYKYRQHAHNRTQNLDEVRTYDEMIIKKGLVR